MKLHWVTMKLQTAKIKDDIGKLKSYPQAIKHQFINLMLHIGSLKPELSNVKL